MAARNSFKQVTKIALFQTGDENIIQKVIIVFFLLHVAALATASGSTYLQQDQQHQSQQYTMNSI